jgi:prepilin-type N-terminal cleavage/methylation domain-containing protein
VKRKKSGLTLIEMLVVMGIIALLVGVLIPALSMVQRTARETKQLHQLNTIELALEAFKNDYGDYPPSEGWSTSPAAPLNYCGAQKLAEALLGWDLLGFQPKSDFRADGYNNAGIYVYDANDPVLFDQRKGPYLELSSDNVFKLGTTAYRQGLFLNTGLLAPNTYVICDAFVRQKIKLPNGKTVSAGAPILYYKANTSQKIIQGIYNPLDNDAIVQIKELADGRGDNRHPLGIADNDYLFFYDYIRDPKIDARAWPYRPDSYILISAGADGLYGTGDDIRNFGNK